MALAEEAKELARLELLEELNQPETEGEEDDDPEGVLSTVQSEASLVKLSLIRNINF